jgi:peptide/nickel transport system substrate-binding protein
MTARKLTARNLTAAVTASLLLVLPARGEEVLRIAMTASDIPTSTGTPNNGFEGYRFLGFPIFEGLLLWDLSRSDRPADLRPGLAESYGQSAEDKKTWVFHLRHGVKFHDGTDFNADAVMWNLDRFFKNDSPQFDLAGSGLMRARLPTLVGYHKLDDYTISLSTREPIAYFPYLVVYMLFTSPASFEKAGHDWGRVATLPAAGTGPFRLAKVIPRELAELARFDGYWDPAHKAKLDAIRLLPIPEANSRLAALRSGQVDWIEVPPPDGIPSLKAAGFTIVTNSYPHVWPWMYNIGASNSPFKDVRVRQALNYCVDRDSLVALLNGTAEPSVGWLKQSDAAFGNPINHYRYDPARGKALLAEAGYTAAKPLSFKVMISTSGSGQMQPLPMNEYLQDSLKQACGVNVELDAVDWTVLFSAIRLAPDSPALHGAMALNFSAPSSDPATMVRFFSKDYFSPNGFNFTHWTDDRFSAALDALAEAPDSAATAQAYRAGHERMVDDAPWLFIVHDLNPRAMSKRVQGFVSAQSWFIDFTSVSMH